MNLTMLLDMAADGFPDRLICGRHQDGLTTARLREMSMVGAESIRAAAADSVVYFAVNGPAFPVAMFAAARAGVPLVPVNYRLGSQQLDSVLANHPDALGIAGPNQKEVLQRCGISAQTPTDWLERTKDGTALEEADDEPDQPAAIVYTSGTTSAPKGVLLQHSNLVSYVLGSVEFASAGPDDAALVSVPPYHIAAVANVITNLFAGRRSIALEQFEPEEWLETARIEGVTNALVVPTMLARIVESDASKDLPSLRTLAYGGAPMPTSVIERALRIWPELDFVNAYGLTETSSTIAVLGPEDHRASFRSDDPVVRARLASVGQALPNIELEIQDVDGKPVGPGVQGRICVRGEQVSAEYAGVGQAVDERGFFDTKDKGYVDDDGYLFISGRADDTIIRGAENIAPAEIEEVLLRHEAVWDAAVFGVQDDEWGERVESAVVLRHGFHVDTQELREFVRQTLRGSKTPDRIVPLPELPRTETGKLLRRQVPTQLAQAETAS